MISAYEHGQNAAKNAKHIQACPFDTGTVEWRAWRAGYHDLSTAAHNSLTNSTEVTFCEFYFHIYLFAAPVFPLAHAFGACRSQDRNKPTSSPTAGALSEIPR
jgi:hypothetical protein